jgi:hypothetical protein
LDRKRVQVIITIVLVIVLIITWKNTLVVIRKHAKAKLAPASETGPDKAAAPAVSTAKTQKLSWVRDPFSGKAYIATRQAAYEDVRLYGVIWDASTPLAMINDKIVKVGDKIDKYKVLKITSQEVVLKDASGNLKTLNLKR